jgi:hypothetical protein
VLACPFSLEHAGIDAEEKRKQRSFESMDQPAADMKIYLRRSFHLLTAVSFAALLFAIYQDASNQNHLASRLETPQPELGRTIPHHARHHTVYISREDYNRVYELEGYRIWSAVALVAFGLIAAGLDRLARETPAGK